MATTTDNGARDERAQGSVDFPHAARALTPGSRASADAPARCGWVPVADLVYTEYHDREWGFPIGQDDRLFEKLVLEGFQAGLSWRTILGKREGFRTAFAGFRIAVVAEFDDADIARVVADRAVVRHRGKIAAAVSNAAVARELQSQFGSLASYIWTFEPAEQTRPSPLTRQVAESLTRCADTDRLSADLRQRGWSFLGPTSAYAFAQATGLVNDHEQGCATRLAVAAARAAFPRPCDRPQPS